MLREFSSLVSILYLILTDVRVMGLGAQREWGVDFGHYPELQWPEAEDGDMVESRSRGPFCTAVKQQQTKD